MKILMVNKFLHPNGGSETYIFKLGAYLQQQGHQVQYFGMEHEGRIVGNHVGAYTSNMDFHGASLLDRLTYPIRTIYSVEARKKIRLVLDDFLPDVVHLNNFNYQLTPSIILEVRTWEKQTGHKCRIVFTAHDSQLVCPNHLMQNPVTGETCTKCLEGSFISCVKGRCIHASLAKSVIGAMESIFWNLQGVYRQLDAVISPSRFLAEKLSSNPDLKERIVVLHNFVEKQEITQEEKENYILFFGRFSKEKGIETLLEVVDQLPHVRFVFVGSGPLQAKIDSRNNIENLGFLQGEALYRVIAKAVLTVVPSECFENCPFTVMESQMYGTPVLGADIGGIPELIRAGQTGELFESGNAEQLKKKIESLWNDPVRCAQYANNCKNVCFDTLDAYWEKLQAVYG